MTRYEKLSKTWTEDQLIDLLMYTAGFDDTHGTACIYFGKDGSVSVEVENKYEERE